MTHDSLTLSEVTATPIAEGDTALILKKDGSFQVANCHETFDPEAMTDMQSQQGRLILAMITLIKEPALLEGVLRAGERIVGGVKRGTKH